jgi:dienelactone hydrolase
VVLYSHGRSDAVDLSRSIVAPAYLRPTHRAGWDVVLVKRPLTADAFRDEATRSLLTAIQQVRDRGYRRIVLAGQSAGGWASLDAARKANIHAVIGTSPAAHGSGPTGTRRGTDDLADLLGEIRPTRVMLFFFENDPFQTPDRGKVAAAVLRQRGIPYRIIDHPPGLAGHAAFERRFFARQFSGEIRNFITAAPK